MTFHLIGSTSSVSVVSSPSLDSLPPQQGQAVGDGRTTRSRGRWAGRGARTGWPRGGLSGRRVRPSLSAAFSALAASSLAAATSSPSSSSSWSISLRPRSEEAPYLSRLSRAISSLRCATIASAPEARASASRRASCSAASAARSAAMSSGEVVRRGRHADDGITAAARQVAPMQLRRTLSRQLRPVCPLRVPPVDSVEHVGQLRARDLQTTVGWRRPDEASLLQASWRRATCQSHRARRS